MNKKAPETISANSEYPKGSFKLIKNFSDPFISEKKNRSDYRVHGIQIDRLNLTVSTQKLVLKNMHRVPRYRTKCVKFCWFGLEGRYSTLFW